MKQIDKLYNKYIVDKGIYNNIDVMENTLESFDKALKKNLNIRFEVNYLKDDSLITFSSESLEKIFNLKDDIEDYSYQDFLYISKYHIPKFEEVMSMTNNTIIVYIKEYSSKILKLVEKKLEFYKDRIIIESLSIKVLKYFKKKEYCVSLLINNKNKRYLNTFFIPDVYDLEIGLFDDKFIRMFKENFYIMGYFVKNNQELMRYKDVYNNLILEVH